MPTPTSRSLRYLKDRGYFAEKVEQRLPIPNKFVTRDLFNFIDIIAIRPDLKEIVGVQTTSGSNVAAHIHKIKAQPEYVAWHQSGGILEIHGWRKLKTGKWELRLLTTRTKEQQIASARIDFTKLEETRKKRLAAKSVK